MGEKYAFLSLHPIYEDEPFELLGQCPECRGQVPVAEVRHLGDLGTHLTFAPTALPETFTHDQGHAPTCRRGESA
ncbi:hypothetical protein DY218_18715 [Streptomyces triticagri]|uniref:Uncharacterized protein n=1 Tax=Streptomyces triticagri TaxID=2293568 RepID=A0A372M2Z7_9ACTN|nr:hypothetical protein [Streptomyces triticagri]RFU85189.1 hypothetical protein DY218_18715 [Streptomyces triticagri]